MGHSVPPHHHALHPSVVPAGGVLTGTRDLELSIALDNLTPSATYHYRLAADNESEVNYTTSL